MFLPNNPYIAGNPVGGETTFVGRADVLREVTRVLGESQANALVLYGQRRIGKTSILLELATQLPQQGNYHPVYVDLQDKAAWTLDQVLADLAREITEVLALPDVDFNGQTDIQTAFRRDFLPQTLNHLPEQHSLVLLFDEFDVLDNPNQQQAGSAFFPYLRQLMELDRKRLQFIFVIGRKPDDLTNLTLSVFKGVRAKRVSLLDRRDTEYLIRLSHTNKTLVWTDTAVDVVWQLTNGHPYLTQQLCEIIWNRAYDEEPDEPPQISLPQVEAAIPETLESSANALGWLWDGLAPAEKYVASVLAQAGPQPIDQAELEQLLSDSGVRVVIHELQEAPQILQEWDLIEEVEGGYRFRVELLRRWIADKKNVSRVYNELENIEPLAKNLYEAGHGYYQANQLDQAIDLLQRVLDLNPNHVRAGLLLAQIWLAQDELSKTINQLEKIYEYNPGAARPRLTQALLQQAEQTKDEEQRLTLFEQVLQMTPHQPEATAGRRDIWKVRGDDALDRGLLKAALHAYQEANLGGDKIDELKQKIRRQDLDEGIKKAAQFEQKKQYQAALEQIRELAKQFPDEDWTDRLATLEQKTRLSGLYQQGLDALEQGDDQIAISRLVQVVTLEPDYEEATRYLHQAVTGEDVVKLRNQLKDEGEARQEAEVIVPSLQSLLEESAKLRKQSSKSRSTPFTKESPGTESAPLRRLSPWNPLDYLRLLWWVLVMPQHLKTYHTVYGNYDEQRLGKWLASLLTWSPLFIPTLALGAGLLPLAEDAPSTEVYLILAGLILLAGGAGDG